MKNIYKSVSLRANNPDKLSKLQSAGIIIEIRTLLEGMPNPYNTNYLETKKKWWNIFRYQQKRMDN